MSDLDVTDLDYPPEPRRDREPRRGVDLRGSSPVLPAHLLGASSVGADRRRRLPPTAKRFDLPAACVARPNPRPPGRR